MEQGTTIKKLEEALEQTGMLESRSKCNLAATERRVEVKFDDIKKGIECCIQPVGNGACNSCPFKKDECSEDGKACTVVMLEAVLDFINRLQSEKEALITGQEALQKHIAEQKAENERLNAKTRTLYKELERVALMTVETNTKGKVCEQG